MGYLHTSRWLGFATLLAASPALAHSLVATKGHACPQECVALDVSSNVPFREDFWQLHARNLTRNQAGLTVWIKDTDTSETFETVDGLRTDADGELQAQAHDALPMSCGHTYQGVVFDPGAGAYYYSNSYTKNC